MIIEGFFTAAVIFLASLLQGVFGFAFMLVALPLLSFSLTMKTAVPLLSLFLALLSGILTFQLRRHFDYRGILPLLAGAVAGIPAGLLFLLGFSDKAIKTALGIVLIVYAAYSLLLKRMPLRLPAWTGYLFGFFAGALGGAFNITGPPVVFYLSTREWSKINIVGSLNLFFCITSILVVAFHFAIGNVTREIETAFLEFIPVMATGMLAGTYIFKRMNEDTYRKGLFILLFIMGVVLSFQ